MTKNTVLIIDDDVWMQRILSKTLQSYGFNDTYLAANGFDGVALAVEHLPSLIIMDILMPELSGLLTLKILKHIKSTKNIPVIMVSALSDSENLGLAVKYGTTGFISKPFTRATVFEKLVAIFGKEKLDSISKGEDTILEIPADTSVAEEIQFQTFNDNQDTDPSILVAKPRVPADQLLQHYQEDDKKDIESIKKLLLKSKK